MAIYKTPGVWVEEIPTLPPSVAQVATAIPAFIGYTQKAPAINGTETRVARISSLLDYESLFGKAKPSAFEVTLSADGSFKSLDRSANDKSSNNFLMYYGLSLYFRNGGGPCYVVSVGNYKDAVKGDFETGLKLLEKEDEPTLIVLLDAVNLKDTEYYDMAQQALAQCKKLGDRFVILDLPKDKAADIKGFRSGIGINDLSYGAAYHPYLQTTLNYQYNEDEVEAPMPGPWQWISSDKGIKVTCSNNPAKVKIQKHLGNTVTTIDFDTTTETGTLSITIPPNNNSTGTEVAAAWKTWNKQGSDFEIVANGDGSGTIEATTTDIVLTAGSQQKATLATIKTINTALYNQIKASLNDQRVMLPPSPAVAGIYARVDGERGVWKAPANVSIASVIGPVSKISDAEQADLNVDAASGKSINAIRAFTGKGTLVWGARTLAGNDNEWRYVPVRRLFITIEESTRKASSFAVFEPNDTTTWLKVKAMIDSYLYGLWEQGALAGSKSEQAYFVNVGLGKTMTAQDILEGRMIVEIGVAAVRPAEFVILRFSHKMQEA